MALQRSTERENRRQQRLGHNRERNFAARLHESEEERSSRLQENRERTVTLRQKESEEERSSRLQENRERNVTLRQKESEEERSSRLQENRERNVTLRQKESEEERSSRLQENRERNVTSRLHESEEERSSRLELRRFNRLAETSEHQQIRLSGNKNATSVSRAREQLSDLKGLAFNYNSLHDYSKHPKVELGKMNVQCRHCHALKWREETPGMCCSNGKVKLSSLQHHQSL